MLSHCHHALAFKRRCSFWSQHAPCLVVKIGWDCERLYPAAQIARADCLAGSRSLGSQSVEDLQGAPSLPRTPKLHSRADRTSPRYSRIELATPFDAPKSKRSTLLASSSATTKLACRAAIVSCSPLAISLSNA